MDSFVVFAFVWFASAIGALAVGYLHGRANDALTLGVLLGPLGLLLAIGWLPPRRTEEEQMPAAVPIRSAARVSSRERAAAGTRRRRAA